METVKEVFMRIAIKSSGLEFTDELRVHTVKRLQFALGRLASRVKRVEVTIVDVNGPRGGLDKSCRIVVRGRSFEDVCVQAIDAVAEAAVSAAAERAGRTVTRKIERQRSRRDLAGLG